MHSRIFWVVVMVALLAACGQAADPPGTAQVAPAAATEAAAATATAAEPSIEDGVDPSVWDNEGEPEGETPAAEISCAEQPLATYFFTLVGGNSVDDCGRKDPQLLAAFDALMKEAAPAESSDADLPPLRERLLSGPSAPGKPLQLQDQTWWYYSACQAHQCSSTALDMLYAPTQATLVGRLVAECKVWWLGAPSAAQRALIEATHPIDAAALQEEGEPCR